MASVSVSHLIIFIASLMVAAAVAGTLVVNVDRISGSVSDQSIETSESIKTDVEIISDTGSDAIVDETENEVTLLVKNTGSTNLVVDPRQMDVLLNGQYVVEDDLTVTHVSDDDESTWQTGEVVEVVIHLEDDQDLTLEDNNRVKVIVNGNEELIQFRS